MTSASTTESVGPTVHGHSPHRERSQREGQQRKERGRRRQRTGRSEPAGRAGSTSDGIWPWLFIAPTIIGIGVMYLAPMVMSFGMSLTSWSTFEPAEFVGFENFTRLASDPQLPRAALNTLIYTAIILLAIPISVVIAALLERPGLRGANIYRALFFLPYIAMPTAISMVWRMIFHREAGVVNVLLGLVGIDGPAWITSEWLALIVVAIVGLWMSIGFKIIVLGAGLRTIPPEVYEAAQIDGASIWRQFFSITVPLLSPSIFFLTVTSVIGGFQLFDLIYAVLGDANPVTAKTQSLVYLFYRAAFPGDDKGYASALSLLILLIVGVVTAIQFRVQKKWVTYD